MRTPVQNVRDAELTLLGKTKAPFCPKRARADRVYVATRFPEWRDACVQAVQAVWVPETAHVDDTKVRALLTERGRGQIKDKCAMPFVQLFKGAQSQARPSSWTSSPCVCVFLILTRAHIETYCGVWSRDGVQARAVVRRDGRAAQGVTRTLTFVDVAVLVVEEALTQVEASKAGYGRVMIESSERSEPGWEAQGSNLGTYIDQSITLSIHSLEVKCHYRCRLPFLPCCRNGSSKLMGYVFLKLKWLLTKT